MMKAASSRPVPPGLGPRPKTCADNPVDCSYEEIKRRSSVVATSPNDLATAMRMVGGARRPTRRAGRGPAAAAVAFRRSGEDWLLVGQAASLR